MDKKAVVVSAIITVFAIAFVGLVLGQQINSISVKLDGINISMGQLYDNTGLTKTVNNISESVVVILTPLSNSNPNQVAAVYVDNNGNSWSIGTGFVIRDDGYILTARHVIAGANSGFIILKNGTQLPIINVNLFTDADLAIIKVNTSLPPVELGDYRSIHIGSPVVFIGYPLFGPTQITSNGIVSFADLSNNMPTFTINSFVNGGNSGGPVFLENSGKVIGVINARESLVNNVPEPAKIPDNISSDTRLILQNQNDNYNKLIDVVKRNVQNGIGIATAVNSSILNLLPPKK